MVDFVHKFEEELRQGLTQRNAPAGFTDKVLSHIPRPSQPRLMHRPFWSWATAAMLLIAVMLGAHLEQRHRQRIAGERARRQVLLALRITSSTLQAVNHKISADRTAREVEP